MNSLPPSAPRAPSEMLSTACSTGNGAVLRICQRTISRRSETFGGTWSSLSSDTLATVSGTISETRDGRLPPSCDSARAMLCDSAGTSATFNAASPGTTSPAGIASLT